MKTRVIQSLALSLCAGLAVMGWTGCASNNHERTAGQYIDDTALAKRVAAELRENAEYKFDDVNVASYKATIQLSGFVNTSEQKKRAAEITSKVGGVKEVINSITLKEKTD
jgi:osmotically-inducible protein OsmY